MNRTMIINRIAKRIKAQSYLEIGIAGGVNFRNINVKHKVGVDPRPKTNLCTHKMTSDEFFEQNSETFDVVFIDGLHKCYQLLRDIHNSLLCCSGVIVCHDLNPKKKEHQMVPRVSGTWTGDCWKAWAKLRMTRDDLTMFVVDTDYGCGVLYRGNQQLISSCGNDWEYFNQHRKEILNLISVEDFNQIFPKVVKIDTRNHD